MARAEKEERQPWSTTIPQFAWITSKERITLFKYLGIMTDSGVPLERSLLAMHNQVRSKTMHQVLHIMLSDVSSGQFLSSSLKKLPHLFNNLLTQLVSVGEESGTMTESFLHISAYLEKAHDLQNKIRSAMLYPVIVIAGTVAIAVYMLFVLLPQLQPLFISLNVKLPWTTQLVLNLSQFLIAYGVHVLVGSIVLAAGFVLLLRLPRFHYAVDALLLRMPILGPVIIKTEITQLSAVISTLLKSGIPIVEGFSIASAAINNRVYQRELAMIGETIQEGKNVSEQMLKNPRLFPPFVSQMISVGEETGRLDECFQYLSTVMEREVDDATKNLTTILEPLLMVLIGVLVGFIAISIITPIYQLTQGIDTVR